MTMIRAAESPADAATILTTLTSRVESGAAVRAGAVFLVAALTAAAAQISVPLPFTPVPLTLQPLVVLLGGAALGSRLGLMSQLLYLAAGLAGLPVFAASPVLPQGLARVIGPTGGYLMSYPIAAFVTGLLAERGFDRRYLTSVAAMGAGLLVLYTVGVSWLSWFMPGPDAVLAAVRAGFLPFVVVDAVKILAGATVLPRVWRFLGARHLT
jgi:biotin transport system substrate-specific component